MMASHELTALQLLLPRPFRSPDSQAATFFRVAMSSRSSAFSRSRRFIGCSLVSSSPDDCRRVKLLGLPASQGRAAWLVPAGESRS